MTEFADIQGKFCSHTDTAHPLQGSNPLLCLSLLDDDPGTHAWFLIIHPDLYKKRASAIVVLSIEGATVAVAEPESTQEKKDCVHDVCNGYLNSESGASWSEDSLDGQGKLVGYTKD